MKVAQDVLEIKLSWKKCKTFEETKQKCHDFLVSQCWKFYRFREILL